MDTFVSDLVRDRGGLRSRLLLRGQCRSDGQRFELFLKIDIHITLSSFHFLAIDLFVGFGRSLSSHLVCRGEFLR